MARYLRIGWAAMLLALLATGCEDRDATQGKPSPEPPDPKANVPVEGKRAWMGENVWLEVLPNGARRVVVAAVVCLRQGPLEQLLTRKNKKEHEAILAADADARKIHNALLVAGAKAGTPVSFDPAFKPATGTRVRVLLVYEKGGRKVQDNARSWVRGIKSREELTSDWVFAGSVLAASPLDPNGPKSYLANEGDVICLANFETAMLDLPIESSKANDETGFEAWTERVPPEGTKVSVILEPVLPKK
jgi:hypothetical protein